MTTTTTPPPATTRSLRPLQVTLVVIATFQVLLGACFLVAPTGTAQLLGLPAAPGWTSWLFAMMAARFLGYGWGMVVAARDPIGQRSWIDTMTVVQAIDWLATVGYLAAGDVGLRNVTTAAVAPLVFVSVLLWFRPRLAAAAEDRRA